VRHRCAELQANRSARTGVNAFITNLNLAIGTYTSQGKPVMSLIMTVGAPFRPTATAKRDKPKQFCPIVVD
jgi:hypothetical protein